MSQPYEGQNLPFESHGYDTSPEAYAKREAQQRGDAASRAEIEITFRDLVAQNVTPTTAASGIDLATPFKELGCDSTDMWQIVLDIEDEFELDLPQQEVPVFFSTGGVMADALDFVQRAVAIKAAA